MLHSRLHYVVAVARNGSFTSAAHAAGVTQSAVTKSVADLEKELGYSIFYRTSRGAILTEQGRIFVDRATRLLEDARELLRGNLRQKDPYAGMLRIGICPASLDWRFVDPLAKLLSQHPAIRYDVNCSTFESVIQQLRAGSIDVAVGYDAAFSEWADVRRVPMGRAGALMFVRQGHPLTKKEKLAIEDIAAFDFISPSESRPYGELIRSFYESNGVDWHERVHRIDNFSLVRRIVAKSDAIGLTGEPFAETEAFTKHFSVLDLDPWGPAPLCCAIRARWEPKPSIRAFIAIVRQSLPPDMKKKAG